MSEAESTPKMDPNALWREETFTDRRVGTIRRLSPIKADGGADLVRKPVFIGEAALVTPGGQLPISFEIPAEDLAQAVAGYGAGLERASASGAPAANLQVAKDAAPILGLITRSRHGRPAKAPASPPGAPRGT